MQAETDQVRANVSQYVILQDTSNGRFASQMPRASTSSV